MQNSAKQVEGMVRMKMEQKEYIILCLEDTNDWSNATTRRLVMQVCTSLVDQQRQNVPVLELGLLCLHEFADSSVHGSDQPAKLAWSLLGWQIG